MEGRALIIGAVLTTNSTYDTGAHPSGHKRHAIPEVEAVSSCYQFATSGSHDGRIWADWGADVRPACIHGKPYIYGRYWRADAGTRTPDPFITSKLPGLRLFVAALGFARKSVDLAEKRARRLRLFAGAVLPPRCHRAHSAQLGAC